jgi:uncharacterized protein
MIRKFLQAVTEWASSNAQITGVLLVGSRVRENARPDSDVDLIFIVHDHSNFVSECKWLERFGTVKSESYEDWGGVKTRRVFFEEGIEVEFNFAHSSWASINPVDPGTYRVVSDGAKILYDPSLRLQQLLATVNIKHTASRQDNV